MQSPFYVIKGKSVGPFQLGMPLFQIMRILDIGPSGTNSAQTYISYNEDEPIKGMIIIKNLPHSLTLYIDSHKQILVCIEIENLKIELRKSIFEFLVFTSSLQQDKKDFYGKIQASFNKMEEREVDNNLELFDDQLTFQFNGKSDNLTEKKKLTLNKMIMKNESIQPLNDYFKQFVTVEVDVTGRTMRIDDVLISHKQHVQQVTADLGFPDGEKKVEFNNDYIYNYFMWGFDILFDGRTHCVKKFILHNNLPNDTCFGVYSKCFYKITLSEKERIVKNETKWSEVMGKKEEKQEELISNDGGVETFQYDNCLFEVDEKTNFIFTVFI